MRYVRLVIEGRQGVCGSLLGSWSLYHDLNSTNRITTSCLDVGKCEFGAKDPKHLWVSGTSTHCLPLLPGEDLLAMCNDPRRSAIGVEHTLSCTIHAPGTI